MPDERTDRIAREAARLIEIGRVDDIGSAVRLAADALGLTDAPRPSLGLVRSHARGMAMQALGDVGYRDTIHAVWRLAEEVMSVLEVAIPDSTALLAGRAAGGQIDAGVSLFVRLYTTRGMPEIVDALVTGGYAEPAFDTAATRFGRLDRVRFEEAGREVVVTRCPTTPGSRLHPSRGSNRDLFSGKPLEVVTLPQLRHRIDRAEAEPG